MRAYSRLQPGIATASTSNCTTCKGASIYPGNGVPHYCDHIKDTGIAVCR